MSDKTTKTLDAAAEVNAAMRAAERALPLLAVKQSPELVAVYAKLANESVASELERIRARARAVCVVELRKARDLLAESGLFKEWCVACGFNYPSAKSRLSRADAQERAAETAQQGAELTPLTSSVASAADGGTSGNTGKGKGTGRSKTTAERTYELKLTFTVEDDYKEVTASLDRIMTERKFTSWEVTLLDVLAECEKRGAYAPPELKIAVGQ